MAGKNKSFFLVFIISLAGLGLGGYSVYTYNFGSSNLEPNYRLVGLWEDVFKNKLHPIWNADSAWLLEVDNEIVLDNEYVILNQTTGYKDTRFHLVKAGLYKITINILLRDLLNSQGYALSAFKDGEDYGMAAFKYLFHMVTPNVIEHINIDFYLESNGTNFFEFGCYTLSAPFSLATEQDYNHLSIEYVKQ